MDELTDRASRGIALAALTVACVVFGPTPQMMRSIERIYAVQIQEDEERRRRRHTALSGRRRRPGPPGRRPGRSRPTASRPEPSRP